MQDDEEQDECMVAMCKLARRITRTPMSAVRETVAAFTHLCALLVQTAPLEAAALHYLDCLLRHQADTGPDTIREEISFLQTHIVVLLEDRTPSAALQLLLELAAASSAAGTPDLVCELLDAALSVYQQYCALPPTALGGLAAFMHCFAQLHGLPRERFDEYVQLLCRYAMSMPVREHKVRFISIISWIDCANLVCELLDAALSVYQQYCALPSTAPGRVGGIHALLYTATRPVP
jgi:hypothetical protein